MTITVSDEPFGAPESQSAAAGAEHRSGPPLPRRWSPVGRRAGHAGGGVVLVARDDGGRQLGCVALRRRDDSTLEIKRMYVRPEARGTGLADRLLAEVEGSARALGAERVKLETGLAQPEAMAVPTSAMATSRSSRTAITPTRHCRGPTRAISRRVEGRHAR